MVETVDAGRIVVRVNDDETESGAEEASNEIIQSIKTKTVIVVISNADFDGLSQNILRKLQNG